MRTLLMLLMLAPLDAYAADWLCTEESSQRSGDVVWACGIGQGATEALARTDAFNSAKKEFSNLCEISDDCKHHEISVQPKRTSCEYDGVMFVCHRLIVFTVGGAKVSDEDRNDPNSPNYPLNAFWDNWNKTYLTQH